MPRWPKCSTLLVAVALAVLRAQSAAAQSLDSLIVRLGAMSAVTGIEDAMSDTLLALLPGSRPDRAGNVVLVRGSGEPVRVAACPMDEVGYLVGGVTPDGYLTLRRVGVTTMGPLYDQFLEGQRVTVFGRRGAVPGVVGVRSTHLTRGRPQGEDAPFSLDNAYVDVGATSAAQVASLGIRVLAPVTRAKRVHRYGAESDFFAAPAMAQRAACAALLGAARRAGPGPGTTIVAFTRRRHFRQDGTAFLLLAYPSADVVVLGGATSREPGSGPAAESDSVGTRSVPAWSLPARYARTPVEAVRLADVRQLEERLVAWLAGAR